MARSLDTMPLQAFFDPTDLETFKDGASTIASYFTDIVGVLAIGSLVQSFRPPNDFSVSRRPGELGLAYEGIRQPERRRVFPRQQSDLDIWICVKDTAESAEAAEIVDLGAIALIEELANGAALRGTAQWARKKNTAFGPHYKQHMLYPIRFQQAQSRDAPWIAQSYTSLLERYMLDNMPEAVARINGYSSKTIPGDFLEVRAFPESLFNLRPEENTLPDGTTERMPFPRIGDDQWISPNHTSFILYENGATIYPFDKNGTILGRAIHDHLKSASPSSDPQSIGAILLKPDAIIGHQTPIIRRKVQEFIEAREGSILLEKEFPGMTADQVATIYPFLEGDDFRDTAAYLGTGKSIAIVVKAPLPTSDMLLALRELKGPRLSERTDERLREGRSTSGSIRDLLPLPEDEERYRNLLPTIFRRKNNPDHRFTPEEYAFYCRNLVHAPDNSVELRGLLDVCGVELSGINPQLAFDF